MNKLEKIKGDAICEVEEVKEKEGEEIVEIKESKIKKFFSVFTFPKKKTPLLTEEDFILEEEKSERPKLKLFNMRTATLVASVLVIAIAGYINIRFAKVPDSENLGVAVGEALHRNHPQ